VPVGAFTVGSCSAVTNKSKFFAGVTVSKLAFRLLSTLSWPHPELAEGLGRAAPAAFL
jgi:hypothetical protein